MNRPVAAQAETRPPCGVLVVDKPRGPTSHDVVARLRKKLGTRAIGHAGTLDPMASGVLVVALGEATKLVPYLTAADKSYEATLALGVETDTLDAEGQVVALRDVPPETLDALREIRPGEAPAAIARALDAERARTAQVPPAFSAIKVEGQRSYARARRGDAPSLEARPVAVRSIVLVGGGVTPTPWLSVSLQVQKGYYVRAFARDLAGALGTLGHLTALRRTASGRFSLDDALPLDASREDFCARLLSLDAAARRTLPSVVLDADAVREARFGRPVPLDASAPPAPGPHAWFDATGRLVAIGERDAAGIGRVLRGFTHDG